MEVLSHGIRRRPSLPGGFPPSTLSVLRLNYCVRDGNRWDPQAIVTGNCIRLCSLQDSLRPPLSLPARSPLPAPFPFSDAFAFRFNPRRFFLRFHATSLRFSSFRFHTFKTAQALRLSPSLLRHLTACRLSETVSFLFSDQALDLLVSSSSIRCRTSTDDLSTSSSLRGLTRF